MFQVLDAHPALLGSSERAGSSTSVQGSLLPRSEFPPPQHLGQISLQRRNRLPVTMQLISLHAVVRLQSARQNNQARLMLKQPQGSIVALHCTRHAREPGRQGTAGTTCRRPLVSKSQRGKLTGSILNSTRLEEISTKRKFLSGLNA